MNLCLRIGLRTALVTRWDAGEWTEERSKVAATVGDLYTVTVEPSDVRVLEPGERCE